MLSLTNINTKAPEKMELLIDGLQHESDRGFVILATAFIEEQIDLILGKKLADRFLFSNKVEIISELFLDENISQIIKSLNKIRNKAAHNYNNFILDYSDPTFKTNIIKKTQSLALYKQVSLFEVVLNVKLKTGNRKEKISVSEFGERLKGTSAVARFDLMIASVVIATYLKTISEHPIMKIKSLKLKFN